MAHKQIKLFLFFFIISASLYAILMSSIAFPLTAFIKPLPIVCLILAVIRFAQDPMDKTMLLLALISSLAGDILLTWPHAWALPAGMLCFMLAHAFYIKLFLADFAFQPKRLILFFALVLLLLANYWMLSAELNDLAIPIFIYGLVLVAMVFTALQVRQQAILIISGACLFLLSDILLGFHLFKATPAWLGVVAIVVYYLAQLLLTAGILFRQQSVP